MTVLKNDETGKKYVANPHEINSKGYQVAGQAAEVTDGKATEGITKGHTHAPGLHVPQSPEIPRDHVPLDNPEDEIEPGDAVSPPLMAGEHLFDDESD